MAHIHISDTFPNQNPEEKQDNEPLSQDLKINTMPDFLFSYDSAAQELPISFSDGSLEKDTEEKKDIESSDKKSKSFAKNKNVIPSFVKYFALAILAYLVSPVGVKKMALDHKMDSLKNKNANEEILDEKSQKEQELKNFLDRARVVMDEVHKALSQIEKNFPQFFTLLPPKEKEAFSFQ